MSPKQSNIKEAKNLIMRVSDFSGDLTTFLSAYNYQPELTKRLDNLENISIDQSVINEIVLWKVNRYVRISDGDVEQFKKLKLLKAGEHKRGGTNMGTNMGTLPILFIPSSSLDVRPS